MLRELKKQHLPAIIFMVYIVLMCLFTLTLPKDDYSSNEKRYLAEFPEISISSVISGDFSDGTETYLADHAPARNLFVGINAYYNLALGQNGSNGVYLSDDGYLINKPAEYKTRYDKNMQIIKSFADKTGVQTNVILAPQPGYILDDKLPAFHLKYNDDDLLKTAETILQCDNLKLIRIDELFKQNSEAVQLYYKTDHHWTSEGAYIAYKAYCSANGLDATEKSDYTVKRYSDFYGTTYSKSALWGMKPDTLEVWQSNKSASNVSVQIIEGNKVTESDTMFFESHANEDDKYPIFLDGNHSMVRIKNNNVKSSKLLIVKDSYAHTLAPFLADNYNEIIMVDLRYYKMPLSKLIEDEKIDNVLFMYSIANIAGDTDLAFLK
ncbi:MAG: DHHW family protein [Acutalibacteraceae bacterium]